MLVNLDDDPDIVLYCQVGTALDMFSWSLHQAVRNAGDVDFALKVICWKTSRKVYDYLCHYGLDFVNMEYDEGKGFLHNLYKGWNLGYEEGFQYADYVVPIATDHSYYKGWLENLYSWRAPNRIVNCKLIEPGDVPTVHTAKNFGPIGEGFDQEAFENFCDGIYKDELVTDAKAYGHRLDGMPFMVAKDVWKKFGPMNQGYTRQYIDHYLKWTGWTNQCTGDTDFFIRSEKGGVEITKALNAISYHAGGVETKRNQDKGIYT